MSSLWPWILLGLLGAYHGLNPAMGWLFAVSLGMQERSRRALDEFTVEGLATVIPFHRAVVSDPAFIGDDDGFTVHTRWIETEWDNQIEPFTGGEPLEEADTIPRQTVVVEVGGRRLEVSLPGDMALGELRGPMADETV